MRSPAWEVAAANASAAADAASGQARWMRAQSRRGLGIVAAQPTVAAAALSRYFRKSVGYWYTPRHVGPHAVGGDGGQLGPPAPAEPRAAALHRHRPAGRLHARGAHRGQ